MLSLKTEKTCRVVMDSFNSLLNTPILKVCELSKLVGYVFGPLHEYLAGCK